MKLTLSKILPFLYGAIVVALAVTYLSYIDFIRIPKDAPIESSLIFGFWWLVVSIFIKNINQLKEKKVHVTKVTILFIILFMIYGADDYFNVADHPLVVFLVVVFWLGIFYLFFPKFFIKYRKIILPAYGLLILYFLYLRSDPNYEELYHHRAINFLLVPVPIFLLLWIYEQWKWIKTIQLEKSKAELELLKSQVNPHFFFNTLNNLYTLTVKQSKKAPEVILKLSDMMRYTIYEGKNEYVPLTDEIEYLKNYISLQELRYQKEVSIQFEYSSLPNDKIAPLLFIILLENAFKHGVEKMTNNAYVKIILKSDKERIFFRIENNKEPHHDLPYKENGIGLDNLKRRLLLIYPDSHKFTVQNSNLTYMSELIIYKS